MAAMRPFLTLCYFVVMLFVGWFVFLLSVWSLSTGFVTEQKSPCWLKALWLKRFWFSDVLAWPTELEHAVASLLSLR